MNVNDIDFDQYLEEYQGLYPEVSPDYDGCGSGFVIKLRKAFKRGSRKRSESYYIAELVTAEISVEAVEPKGLRPPLSKKVKLSELYSFCIDERIYFRRLISKPSLGQSPPLFS
ncbi:MAG TPA: hypothetical protein PLP88_06475 [Bacteroidales bacterium]|nr:hypothetical protein [Bacteroidales bacterium]